MAYFIMDCYKVAKHSLALTLSPNFLAPYVISTELNAIRIGNNCIMVD